MKKLLLGATMAALLLGMAAIPASATTTDSATRLFVSAPKVPAGAIQVINITYDVTNDEDSGMVGYWALDNYNRVFQVWQLPDGTFYALGNYNGKWQTFAGARSPGVGVVQGSDATGTMHGGWTGTFNAASCTSTFGNVGSFDFGGTKADILKGTYGAGQTGPTTPFSALGTYCTGVSNFNYISWGWTYLFQGQAWYNFDSGTTGDIVVP